MLFVGPLIALFWASGDVFSGFQRWVESVALFILGRGICNIHSLRITPGVTPADLLMASMAAGRFIHTCNRLFLKECGLPRTLVPWHAPNTPKKHLYFINCRCLPDKQTRNQLAALCTIQKSFVRESRMSLADAVKASELSSNQQKYVKTRMHSSRCLPRCLPRRVSVQWVSA